MDDFARARRAMVDSQLRPNGVTDLRLLAAMGELPRERFVPGFARDLAYIDEDLPLTDRPDGRCLMEPMSFARLAQLAEIDASSIVLDIACGTGYGAAVLARLAGAVVAVDDDAALVAEANENFAALDIGNAAAVTGPLTEGRAGEAPFDAILIEGAVETVPEALLAQLKEGGRLAAFVQRGPVAVATVRVRSDGEFAARQSFDAAVPRLAAFAAKREFQF